VPITVSEQVESTQEAFEASATIVHAHARNDDENPSSDPEKSVALNEGIERYCPGMIIQFSTGGGPGLARRAV
jgi:3-keto-5-aminohexanoate cleavage enzyme